jgi:hypothetical protein|tara:strand:- start:635 stop:1861 length:1227 start_codon:yes stop_codon:yes gene_type:complete
MADSLFEQLEQQSTSGGVDAVLKHLISSLQEDKKHHELFEALKMQARHLAGLPLLYGETDDDLDSQQRTLLEDGLLGACRQVGTGLLEDGRVSEGWMYMRPVGDMAAARELINKIEIQDDNIDEMVEVLLQEGVDPARGFSVMLQNFGTCNAITTYESVMPQKGKADQRAVAQLLLRHVHQELFTNVKADVSTRQDGDSKLTMDELKPEPAGTTLAELIDGQEGMFGEHSYHIDTTHLASTTRISRILEDEESLRLALDLTQYGKELHEQFQYEGEEPFTDIYRHHAFYYQALLGENLDEALAHFKDRSDNVDPKEWGTAAIEIYIDLLARVGKIEEAIAVTIEKIKPGQRTMGLAPSLLELCERGGNYSPLMDACRGSDDVLGFATGLMQAKTMIQLDSAGCNLPGE